MSDVTLTDRQTEFMEFLRTYIAEHSFAPSIRDFCDRFRMTPNSVRGHLVRLQRKNAIGRHAGKARSITVCHGKHPRLNEFLAVCDTEPDSRFDSRFRQGWFAAMAFVRDRLANKDGAGRPDGP